MLCLMFLFCFPQWLHHFIFSPTMHKGSIFFLTLTKIYVTFCFCFLAILMGGKWYLMVSVCIWLMMWIYQISFHVLIFPFVCLLWTSICLGPLSFKKKFTHLFSCARSQLPCVGVFIAACGIQFPSQGLNLCPLHWQHRVLIAGPPGKSPFTIFIVGRSLLNTSPLSVYDLQIFVSLCGCLFIFFTVSFEAQTFYKFEDFDLLF